ncbi:MAG: hypothetical protein ABSD63_12205 [Candidatus Korobacteraceae bacterium]|jgi:hypothetical protein
MRAPAPSAGTKSTPAAKLGILSSLPRSLGVFLDVRIDRQIFVDETHYQHIPALSYTAPVMMVNNEGIYFADQGDGPISQTVRVDPLPGSPLPYYGNYRLYDNDLFLSPYWVLDRPFNDRLDRELRENVTAFSDAIPGQTVREWTWVASHVSAHAICDPPYSGFIEFPCLYHIRERKWVSPDWNFEGSAKVFLKASTEEVAELVDHINKITADEAAQSSPFTEEYAASTVNKPTVEITPGFRIWGYVWWCIFFLAFLGPWLFLYPFWAVPVLLCGCFVIAYFIRRSEKRAQKRATPLEKHDGVGR